MVIPEGRELWGWRGFNQVLIGLLEPRRAGGLATDKIDPRVRLVQVHDQNLSGQYSRQSFKDTVIHGGEDLIALPKIARTSMGGCNMGKEIANH